MSEEALQEARTRRAEAWARFNGRKQALREGLAEQPIPTRIKNAAMDHVIDAVDEAKAVAKDNLPVIGGTLALLAAWFFRRPLITLIKHRFAPAAEADEDAA
ncbi:hypothetical protein AQZ52_09675 [Novosphingobium fuchskuhlense]|uniref:Uncharacterized protein n=1 Tax=Novosphingobium fuchskuhlense TaxID=1117702 RepID=A0A117UVX8_9SPHN|nr:hypothetical protein [Novosphingobium fuchskuhlense]KUR71841.1 hypothetical protein AQZ52_09675 [Novosphingobium fuchskuhlense]